MHGRISQAAAVVMVMALLITGCTSQASNIGMAKDKEHKVVDTGFTVSSAGSYDSADTAVVITTDSQNKSVTFMNMSTARTYTLYYDGTTYVKDKYDGPMSISQIRGGDVVDVNFLKGKRQIASMQLSPEAWVYDNVQNYNLGGAKKTASIGSSTYSLPDDVVVLSDSKRVEVMDIVKQDVVTVRGIGHEIYSINVEKGHGYLRLKNDQALIGGWIEVGNSVIKEITEDMLLVVPEGKYQVFLTNNGVGSTKDVVIERDKEVVLDVGDIETVQDKTGKILLAVSPEDAKVTIDGKAVDISSAVELPYGIHKVYVEAEGYDSLSKYIQVGSEYASISFTLEEKKEEDEDETPLPTSKDSTEEKKPDESISENTITPTKGNKVYIDAPKNVEVYLDSTYVGISPVSFKKSIGSHTITLRKSGYKTKSYTIYLYNDGEDVTYSFTDLEKEKGSVSDNKNTSGDSSYQEVEWGSVSGNFRYPFLPEDPDEDIADGDPGTGDGFGDTDPDDSEDEDSDHAGTGGNDSTDPDDTGAGSGSTGSGNSGTGSGGSTGSGNNGTGSSGSTGSGNTGTGSGGSTGSGNNGTGIGNPGAKDPGTGMIGNIDYEDSIGELLDD